MKQRNLSLIIIVCFEIALILFLSIFQLTHNLWGYIGLGVTILLTFLTIWITLFPKSKKINPTGRYSVLVKNITLVDESRLEPFKNDGCKRSLQVKFWSPKGVNSCPLVVFSHGSFGNVDNNETLLKELASQGYVCASIGHTYMASKVLINNKTIKMSKTFKKEVIKINPENKKQEALILYKKWMDVTTKDSCFVIDKIKDNIDEISNIIDKSKICVMGHSFGGSTALALGRIRKDIYAVVALESPFMYDVKSIENDKFVFEEEEYPTRMLNVYSDSSYSNLRIWNQYSQNYKYLNLNNGKYKSAYLKGLGHMHLCDFQLVSPLFSWILSGVDSPNLAKDNLKMLNKTILEYFNEISF